MVTKGRRGPRNPAETRRRIVEATVALHEEIGPASTTITAIAERAGVQRLTVYRHFPDLREVFKACSAHWLSEHPLPDTTEWAGSEDPMARLRTALSAIYAYYRAGEGMLAPVLRDEPEVPALAEVMIPFHAWFRELAGQLSAGWGGSPQVQKAIRVSVGHALGFEAWRSLIREGLSDEAAVEIFVRMVGCMAGRTPPPQAEAE